MKKVVATYTERPASPVSTAVEKVLAEDAFNNVTDFLNSVATLGRFDKIYLPSHPQFKTVTGCLLYLERLAEVFNKYHCRTFLNAALPQHLLAAMQIISEFSDLLYEKIIKDFRLESSPYPIFSKAALKTADTIYRALSDNRVENDVMIGVLELSDGRLIAGFSGNKALTARLESLVKARLKASIIWAYHQADTSGFKRFVRFESNGAIKTHNGFECVEAKLFQTARDQEKPSAATGFCALLFRKPVNRYAVDPRLERVSKPCPACVINALQIVGDQAH